MNFEQISKLVAGNYDLPSDADLTDQQAYHTLKSLNFQFKSKMVSREKASSEKEKIIKAHKKQRDKVNIAIECSNRQIKNISITEQLRMKLNIASRDGKISKQLWLDAIECINRTCGSVAALKSCEKYLEGIEYEEQERIQP